MLLLSKWHWLILVVVAVTFIRETSSVKCHKCDDENGGCPKSNSETQECEGGFPYCVKISRASDYDNYQSIFCADSKLVDQIRATVGKCNKVKGSVLSPVIKALGGTTMVRRSHEDVEGRLTIDQGNPSLLYNVCASKGSVFMVESASKVLLGIFLAHRMYGF